MPLGFTGDPLARGSGTLLKRLLLIGLFVGIGVAYIGPVQDYLGQKEDLRLHQVALIKARDIRDAISTRIRALKEPAVLESRARELGMVRPGERTFAVRGIRSVSPPPAQPAGDQGATGVWGLVSGILG